MATHDGSTVRRSRDALPEPVHGESEIVVSFLLLHGPTELGHRTPHLTSLLENPEWFEDLRHRKIVAAVKRIHDSEDLTTVRQALAKSGDLKRVGSDYLQSLMRDPPVMEHAESLAAGVCASGISRAAGEVSQRFQRTIERDPERAHWIIDDHIRGLSDLATSLPGAELPEKLWFDPNSPPPEATICLSLAGVPFATAGNLSTLTAQKKSGKTAVLQAIAAASLSTTGDTLGFSGCNSEQKTVLHFDTEQGECDFHRFGSSVLRRAQLIESDCFKSAWLKTVPIRKRRAFIERTLRAEAARNGVFLVIIDGYADLVTNVNDPEEAAEFVDRLQTMAIEFDCHIIGALHLNPGSDFKSRGHLGSELGRKSETNLQVEKKDERFGVWFESSRGAPLPRNAAPSFAWDANAKMHMSIESIAEQKEKDKVQIACEMVEEAFRLADAKGLFYTPLINALQKIPSINSESTAHRMFSSARKAGFIRKNIVKQWELTP